MSPSVTDKQLFRLVERLFPLHRSITGDGVRETLRIVQEIVPLEIHEVPSGTKVFDWSIPKECRVRDAFVANAKGERLIDYRRSNLHVFNHSQPVELTLTGQELQKHLVSLPERPQAIPYRTAYFRDDWGFCLSHHQRESLFNLDDLYHVCIDSEHFDGSLSYGEYVVPGHSKKTVLIYCHTCHPSLANDNLSGIVVAAYLARVLAGSENRLTYRFVFAPATIGAIAWLAQNEQTVVPQIVAGFVLSLLGSDADFTYKRSRRQQTASDRVATSVVCKRGGTVRNFAPFGYDERQFCSPGFNLPVGCLSRAPFGEFPEYHTSDDNLTLVSGARLLESLEVCREILRNLDNLPDSELIQGVCRDESELSVNPSECRLCPVGRVQKGEPFLGRYRLYRGYGQSEERGRLQEAAMWILNLGDGRHSVDDIIAKSGIERSEIWKAIDLLNEHDLIELAQTSSPELGAMS